MRRFAAILLLSASEALAHAELVSSTPAQGAALDAAPARIELRFNEPVRPIVLRLVDADGRALPLAPSELAGEAISVPVPGPLAQGHYTLSFRVTSLDSHLVGGSIVFGVGVTPRPRDAPADAQDAGRVWTRFVRDVALLFAAGGALFVRVLGVFPHYRALLRSAALIGAGAAVLGIGMQGTGLHSSFGLSACVAVAGLLAIASLRRGLMVAGAVAALASLPLTGHALVAHPPWLAINALLAHGLAAAFWAGSLGALVFILRSEPQRAAAALRGFSAFGMAAVAVLVASGITLAWLQLQDVADLVATSYGRFILLKAGLLVLLIGLAAINRYSLLARLEGGRAGARGALVRTISAEQALMAAVLAATAFLVHTPPERATSRKLESDGRKATLSVSPARAGANVIAVRTAGAQEVAIELANPAAGVEPMLLPMRRVAADDYRYDGTALAVAGAWDVTVHARISDFETIRFATKATIR